MSIDSSQASGTTPAGRARRWGIRLLVATTAALLALAGSEIIYRLAVYRSLLLTPALTSHHHSFFCEYDPLLGWRHKSNTTGRFITSEDSAVLHFNAQGLRGSEIPYEKTPGVFRVVVLGDSFVEGYTVDWEHTITEVLKNKLNATFTPRTFEVINAGVAGYSTDQEYLLMREIGVKYQPDLTIVMFCYNDIYFNNRSTYERGGKPVFTVDGESLRLINTPVPTPIAASVENADEDTNSPFVSMLFRELSDRLRGPTERARPFSQSNATSAGDPWRITELLIKELSALPGVGGHLVVSYIPRGTAIEPQSRSSDKVVRPEEASDSKRLGEICARNGIEYLDLTDALRAASKHEQMYFTRDPHWNRNGNRVAAESLAGFIHERSLVE
jgi:hypothetical protein